MVGFSKRTQGEIAWIGGKHAPTWDYQARVRAPGRKANERGVELGEGIIILLEWPAILLVHKGISGRLPGQKRHDIDFHSCSSAGATNLF